MSKVTTSNSKAALKHFLDTGHRLLQRQSSESVISTLHGHPLQLRPHQTPSVLSSASLLTSYIKNWITRNRESVTTGTVKRIIGLCDYKHQIWRYQLDQRPRQQQYAQVSDSLKLELKKLQLLQSFRPTEAGLTERITRLQENISKVHLTADLMKESVSGSLHPDTASEGLRLRGFLLRLAGPRKGNRAMTWERSVGATSTNSVDYVIAEESKCQLPSKMGTFGLTVRMVYERCKERPLESIANANSKMLFDGIDAYKL